MTNDEILMQPSVPMWKQLRRSKVLALLSAGLAFSCVFLARGRASAAEYYVSPTGSDSNPGTQASPFASLQKANNSAAAGDTIWMRAGTYSSTGQITLSKSGTSDTNRTKIWAYPGEVPVIDFSNYSLASSGSDNPAITVTGSWMHLKGLEIANGKVGSSGSHSYSMLRTKGASNNTFELLNIHHGFGPGLFIDTGNGGNLILNCDSHDNYDKDGSQGDGQNGDGFGVHYQTSGPSTIIRGCRTWVTSDDGYDFIYQEVPVTIENSWAIQAGYANGGSTSPGSGNGNGFKIGSRVLREPLVGRQHLVQQHVLQQRHPVQHAGLQLRCRRKNHRNGCYYPVGHQGAHHAEQHRLSQQKFQHGWCRHRVQLLGFGHYPGGLRFRQHLGHRLHRPARGGWQHAVGLRFHEADSR
jgi:hypothetical protein